MLPIKKITIVGVLVLGTIIYYQNVQVHSDSWKQGQIETMYRKYAQEFPQVKQITVTQLQQLQKQGTKLVLVDVRSPKEIAVSRIPGAITAVEFERHLAQYQDTKVVAYCTIGYRSGLYAQKLGQQGVEVLNLEGSLLAWSHAGEINQCFGHDAPSSCFGRQWQLTLIITKLCGKG
ncbi:MAG: rhodanese-like domain-containing protein, partial [Hydrococcus sp. SU_1_0]|nr:rhodanese-like domain-containing protein [Hydrococcus sp. SU_1_0]